MLPGVLHTPHGAPDRSPSAFPSRLSVSGMSAGAFDMQRVQNPTLCAGRCPSCLRGRRAARGDVAPTSSRGKACAASALVRCFRRRLSKSMFT